MKFFMRILVAASVAAAISASTIDNDANDILLATFDGAKGTTRTFRELNDPVMGGKSTGTFTTSTNEGGYGIFDGEVVNVPALKAPGFIKAQSSDSGNDAFPDIHARKCQAMVITARAKYPYDGYKLQFGNKRSLFCSFFSSGFKAPFAAPVGDTFQRVVIPLTNFSDCNSDSTGKPKKTCADDKNVCPDAGTLEDMKTVAVWAEGAAGKVHLEIQSIAATGCGAAPAAAAPAKPSAVQLWAASTFGAAPALGDHCANTEYCCPDAKHCLTPTKVSCAKDASVCASDQTCCPLTKLCVHVGKPCATPCKESNTYCCPDALACLEPTNPGVLCGDASDCDAANGEVCCPLTKICVKPHEKCAPQPFGADVVLATFDGAEGTTRAWRQQNDPVMGGKSTGTFSVGGGLGTMDGDVVNVPFLKAPGFIKASTVDTRTPFPDVSHCSAIKLTARATSGYAGYRFSFGNEHPPGGKTFSFGFKAHFDAPNQGDGFQDVVLPFTNFTDLWDDATGDAIKTCAQDARYCPDAKALRNLVTMSVWGEGVAGKVHLEIQRIAATGCAASRAELAAGLAATALGGQNRVGKDTCAAPVQGTLRYIGRPPTYVPDLPLPLAQGESLADAICCDSAFAPYAEPRWYYNRTDVGFFDKVAKAYKANGNKPVTFYDSVCGLPLFHVPRNRTLAAFMAETKEHGWPSFRPAELASPDAVKILPNNYVVSKCGTHLGSNLPDAKGIRYCLDLSCVSGNPK